MALTLHLPHLDTANREDRLAQKRQQASERELRRAIKAFVQGK